MAALSCSLLADRPCDWQGQHITTITKVQHTRKRTPAGRAFAQDGIASSIRDHSKKMAPGKISINNTKEACRRAPRQDGFVRVHKRPDPASPILMFNTIYGQEKPAAAHRRRMAGRGQRGGWHPSH